MQHWKFVFTLVQLSLLSLLMLVGTIVGVYYKTASQGMVEFLCSADSNAVTGWLGWSMYLYYLSKVFYPGCIRN